MKRTGKEMDVKIFILVEEMNLNRALHCNQMIIHNEREKTHTHT
jgi:hypothetical protein